jgi:chromate transporter
MQTLFTASKTPLTHDGSFKSLSAHSSEAKELEQTLPPNPVSFWEALLVWLKLGFISFGGPAGQISLLHNELVVKRRWLSESRFVHAMNYCIVLPGPEGQQLATYIGWLMHRTWGGLVAGILFVLPAFFMLITFSWLYMRYGNTAWVVALLYGIKPAIVIVVAQVLIQLGLRSLFNRWLCVLAMASFLLVFMVDVSFSYVVIAAAIIGGLVGRVYPSLFNQGLMYQNKHVSSERAVPTHAPALIDDNTPSPYHALYSKRRTNHVLVVGAVLWLAPMLGFGLGLGWDSVYVQLAWFFTKAALLTFGGAYTMLPYIDQGAVNGYHWLSAEQMQHGFALSEATPGPLVILVTFVGFVAGYHQSPDPARAIYETFFSGLIGACIATWFTFLPSFMFVFVGGPIIERTRKTFSFTSPLNAINAAVTGVLLTLVIRFAHQALLPEATQEQSFSIEALYNLLGRVDRVALFIALVSAVALWGYKRSVLEVLLGAALLGFLIN